MTSLLLSLFVIHKPIPRKTDSGFSKCNRNPPEPTRAPRRVATHPDARAARSAPCVLVPAGGRGSCLALSVGSLAWSLRYFLRPLLPFLRNRSVSLRQLSTEAMVTITSTEIV